MSQHLPGGKLAPMRVKMGIEEVIQVDKETGMEEGIGIEEAARMRSFSLEHAYRFSYFGRGLKLWLSAAN